MLGEVMDVFSIASLTSFVDCTLGAAGHSTAVIKRHPEMKFFVGMDVDFVAHDVAQPRLDVVLSVDVKAFTVLRNFRDVKSMLREFSDLQMGIDDMLMDLGMSFMQDFGYLPASSSVIDEVYFSLGSLDMHTTPC